MRISGKGIFTEENQNSVVFTTNGTTRLTIAGDGTITPAGSIVSATASSPTFTGTISIGGATDSIGFYGATATTVQSSTATTAAAAFVAGGATAATSASQWSGNTGTRTYGVNEIVSALKAYGLLTA